MIATHQFQVEERGNASTSYFPCSQIGSKFLTKNQHQQLRPKKEINFLVNLNYKQNGISQATKTNTTQKWNFSQLRRSGIGNREKVLH
jgi:hypothetical protein